MTTRRKAVLDALAACCAAALTPLAQTQQTFPNRPITVVVPFAPAGGSDIVTRVVAQAVSNALNANVIVENRAGAGGTIGSAAVARAQPDGYMLVSLTTSTHSISPSVYAKLSFDPSVDISPIGVIGTSAYVLVVNPGFPARSLVELVAEVKRHPGKYSIASAGNGTMAHLIAEQFKKDADLKMEHVPYQGASAAYPDLISGLVAMVFDNPTGVLQNIRDGRLRAIAQTAESALLPEVPTFAGLGMTTFRQELWYGIAGPKGMAPEVVARLNAALNSALSDRKVSADLLAKGVQPVPGTPGALLERIESGRKHWGGIADAVGIKPQ